MNFINESPAYGRQRISRPMQIVAQIPASKAKFTKKWRNHFTPFMSKKFQI